MLEQRIYLGDNLELLARLPDGAVTLIYIDPPFNTGDAQRRLTLSTSRDEPAIGPASAARGTAPGCIGSSSYPDRYDDYLAFIEPRLREARRLLADDGTLYFHIDYREAHYCKVLLDEVFGRDAFLNEIIWAYDYGGARQAPLAGQARHDPRLREGPRRATSSTARPSTASPTWRPVSSDAEKAARGKLPTDVWWHTIVSPTGSEKTGYPTQKPLGVLRRIVQASSRRATGASTSSPAAARSAPPRSRSGVAASCATPTRRRSR